MYMLQYSPVYYDQWVCFPEDSSAYLNVLSLSMGWVASFFVYEPGSSVSLVCGYGLDDQAIEVGSLAEAKEFFL
jgi:hypothetical protein